MASGSEVNVTNFPATQIVEVSNFPVGGSEVSVTNLPATQAVSAVSLPLPSGASTETTLAAIKAKTDNLDVALSTRTKPADTQTVSGSVSVSNFPATQPVSLASAPTTPVTGTFFQATQPVSGTITANAGTGTFATRDLCDTGRQVVSVNWEEMAGTANAESALANFTSASRNAGALGAANNFTVTAGKTLRIQSIRMYVKATSTVTNLSRFRIRQAASNVANNSPIIFDDVLVGSAMGAVTAGAGYSKDCVIPDGLEVAGGQQLTFTWLTAANTCTVGMMITGYEY